MEQSDDSGQAEMMASTPGNKALIDHIRYARHRANLLATLGLAALLAWWALPPAPAGTELIDRAYRAHSHLMESELSPSGRRALRWIANAPLADLDRSARVVRDAASAIESAGEPAPTASYFGVSEERDRLLAIQSRFEEHEFAHDAEQWTRTNFDDVATIIGGKVPDEPGPEQVQQARRELIKARSNPAAAGSASTGLDAIERFEKQLHSFRKSARPVDAPLGARLRSVAILMEELGFERPEPLIISGDARATTRALQQGSLSVLGFSIPGLAVRLLLPIIAVCLAIDLALAATRAKRFAFATLPATEIRTVLRGFPWLFTPEVRSGEVDVRSKKSLAGNLLPLFVLSAPAGAMLPLVLSGRGNGQFVGIVLLIAVVALQLEALSSFRAMAKTKLDGPGEHLETGLWGDLAREHINGAIKTMNVQLVLSAAILAFFLALVLVPSHLLEDHRALSQATTARQAFARAYDQRLVSHSDAFLMWCTRGCEVWSEFSFARMLAPDTHPATPLLDVLSQHPVVRAQMPATSHVQDLVRDSRAQMPELDRFDLAQTWEVLERNSFDDIIKLLGDLRTENSIRPLPADVVARLPEGVSGPASAGASVPFVVPYRTFVERGGFADRLAPLPDSEAVDGWFRLLDRLEIETVAGFDRYADAIKGFDDEIGKARLKIAGIEVTRAAARDVALVALLFFSAGLAFRLQQTRTFLATDKRAAPHVIRATPGILLTDAQKRSRLEKWSVDLACCGGSAAVASLVVLAPASSPDRGLSIAILAGIVITSVLAARWRRQLVEISACEEPS